MRVHASCLFPNVFSNTFLNLNAKSTPIMTILSIAHVGMDGLGCWVAGVCLPACRQTCNLCYSTCLFHRRRYQSYDWLGLIRPLGTAYSKRCAPYPTRLPRALAICCTPLYPSHPRRLVLYPCPVPHTASILLASLLHVIMNGDGIPVRSYIL